MLIFVGILRCLLCVIWQANPETIRKIGQICGIFNESDELQSISLSSVVQNNDKAVELITFLYHRCLFPYNSVPTFSGLPLESSKTTRHQNSFGNSTESVGLCQSQQSRTLAYELLLQLCCKDGENMSKLLNLLNKEGISVVTWGDTVGIRDTDAQNVDTEKRVIPHTPIKDKYARRGSKDLNTLKKKKKATSSSQMWEYDPNSLVKHKGAYMGLVNQGSTCYMNALLQQLFHIPSFVNKLLTIEVDNSILSNYEQSEKANDGQDMDYNTIVLYELQVMFCFLKFSQKKYYDTIKFCKSFKDYDNQSIKLTEQKDINEFASLLFEKLEQNKICKSLLCEYFGGKIVNKIISLETDYVSEREEPFYILTIDIKNKSTLEDSLKLFIAEEIMSGDNKIEDSVNKVKVNASKRCCLRQLPKILVIHLKRFEFDLETMNRKKINDKLAFPNDLDMFPYTEEGLVQSKSVNSTTDSDIAASKDAEQDNLEADEITEERRDGDEDLPAPIELDHTDNADKSTTHTSHRNYRYQLKGIVVHAGAIDSGHYYSYIRDPCDVNRWLEYNDSLVMPFNADSIPSDCFGGKSEHAKTTQEIVMKQHSAYMLFYESMHVEKTPVTITEASIEDPPSENASTSAVSLSRLRSDSLNDSKDYDQGSIGHGKLSILTKSENDCTIRAVGQSSAINAVWAENMEFVLDRSKFNKFYFSFHWQLLHSEVFSSPNSSMSQSIVLDRDRKQSDLRQLLMVKHLYIALQFIIEVAIRGLAVECVSMFFNRITAIVKNDKSGLCAAAILTELSKDPFSYHHVFSEMDAENTPSSKAAVTEYQMTYRERTIHPWLVTLLATCPHSSTTALFANFLLSCFKSLKPLHQMRYLEIDQDVAHHVLASSKGDMEHDIYSPKSSELSLLRQSIEDKMESCHQYKSCVTRVIGKLLILMDSLRTDDVFDKKGTVLTIYYHILR